MFELEEIMELCSIQYREYEDEFDMRKYQKSDQIEVVFTDMNSELENIVRDVVKCNLRSSINGKQFCKNVIRKMSEHSKYW